MTRLAWWSALPTWSLALVTARTVGPLHPWHGRRWTLSEWAAGRSALCRKFDAVFWLSGAALLLAAAVVVVR